jgi:hypothetical protein
MARIRSIKPSFFTSISNSELPISTRLTFIGLWTFVDDDGRAVDDARLVKAEVWPLDDAYTTKKVEADLVVLEKTDKIERYIVDGRRYLRIRKWKDHQRINRPQPSKLPPSPEEGQVNGHRSHGGGREDRVSTHGTLTAPSPPEGKGREEEGSREKEGNARVDVCEPSSSSSTTSHDDDDRKQVIARAWRVIGERRFDQRNRELTDRGGTAITGEVRRRAWLVRDAEMSEEILGRLARSYLDADPTLTGEDLADLLTTQAADLLASSPLFADDELST